MARDPERNEKMARILREATIYGTHSIERIASLTGITASALYAYAHNQNTLPAWLIPVLYHATKDLDLFSTMSGADDCGLTVSERPAGDPSARDALLDALELGGDAGRVLEILRKILGDGRVTAAEMKLFTRWVDHLQSHLEALRAKVSRLVK